MKQVLKFPNGFLWGAACASYQVEGGNNNCDWAKAAREGIVPICDLSADHYRRYEADFDLARGLGHNCHRLSIEWARVEPEEGKFDFNEVAHYKNVIAALKTRGLEPLVTLWHFTLPIWFSASGGFENPRSPEQFGRYAEFAAKEILGEVKLIQTMNEPMVWIGNGYLHGHWPPFRKNYFVGWKALRNLIKAHRLAYGNIKSAKKDAMVSIAKNNMCFLARGVNPINYLLPAFFNYSWNRYFLNKIISRLDFIGLNFYKTMVFGPDPSFPKTEMGWDIYPEGLYRVLMELKRYKMKIFITENGLSDSTDSKRRGFIADHLAQVHRAIRDGVDVRGYFHWSLLDNYEWAEGFEKRFGMIEINFKTQERKVRPSAYFYKEICETNSLILENQP